MRLTEPPDAEFDAEEDERDNAMAVVESKFKARRQPSSEEPSAGDGRVSPNPFDFFAQWWPLYVFDDLPRDRPLRIMLLGVGLVVWYEKHADHASDPAEGFRVFVDACPHRLAPLSEGRIVDHGDHSTIECLYHGWQFSEDAKCTLIPQAADQSVACSSPQSSAMPLIAHAAHGMLWVWAAPLAKGDDSIALMQPLPRTPSAPFDEEMDGWSQTPLYFRELPYYGFNTLVENIVDPAHVPFAHHGVQGRRENAGPLHMRRDDAYEEPDEATRMARSTCGTANDPSYGIAVTYGGTTPRGATTTHTAFRPSRGGVVTYDFTTAVGKIRLCAWLIPVAPLASRAIITIYSRLDLERLPFLARIVVRMRGLLPAWVDHLTRNAVFDGDAILLHVQERLLAKKDAGDWRKAYCMPTASDLLVTAFRSWWDRFVPNGMPYDSDSDDFPKKTLMPPRSEILNRYDQHTKHCASCRAALVTVRGIAVVCGVLGLLFAATAMSIAFTDPSKMMTRILMLGGAATAFAVLSALSARFAQRFVSG